jgi:phosphatidylserine/phosphatidylglycerophosphate/cardiolipin synthase-like enzyme
MPSNGWRALGTANVLGFLRADLKRASFGVWVIGPWIDAFLAQMLVDSLPAKVELRVVTRPTSGADSNFREHAIAARVCFEDRPNTEVKLLANLHAKLVIIDEHILYCGSANWYRYSLEESREIVLRGLVDDVSEILDEAQVIWDEAKSESPTECRKRTETTAHGYMVEVMDPVAEAKLKEVPGSFILRGPRVGLRKPHK